MCFNTIKIIRIVLLLALLILPACGGGDGGPLPPTTFPIGGGTLPVTPPSPLVNTADDPLYVDQWHLKNTGQLGATGVPGIVGQDMNVEPAWTTRSGAGIRIAIVDDGLEIAHEDLAGNVAAGLSHNYLNAGTDPTGGFHGTAVAGIAASIDNTLGGIGAAPRANMVGYNYLQNQTITNEADAMTRGSPNVHISNNSWGPPDDGFLHASGSLWRTAITAGLSSGRNGLGTIYTWSAGNGGTPAGVAGTNGRDNSNYDGMTNNRGVIAVAAVNDQGVKSSYSEHGANIWISAPGGEFCDTHTITTTDRTGGIEGANTTATAGVTDYANTNYTKCFNGTSAAAPGASGVIALVLEARPTLGWRDVRLILAQSARKNDAGDAGWTTSATTPAYNFNHKYGFGVIDAAAAVTLASSWTNVGTEVIPTTPASSPGLAIPDNNPTGVSNTITVGASGIANIEFIEITFSATDHTYFGDLDITLTSPAGTVSQLSEQHFCVPDCSPASNSYNGWVFGSARHLGEAADGNWILTVKDLVGVDTGTFQSWGLKFYGR
jgi:proprotein convertase subtilisin/kexin type 2